MTVDVAVAGATGIVGQRLLTRLADHPWFSVQTLAASESSAGSTYREAVTWRIEESLPSSFAEMEVVPTNAQTLTDEADLVLSALPGSVAVDLEPAVAEAGGVVCSNASPFRTAADVPLIIPEVNAAHLDLLSVQRRERGWDGAIVKNPNCTAVTVTLPLAALMPFRPRASQIVTMQAISGAGATGVAALDAIDNVLPNIPGEAEKLTEEPLKLLGTVENGALEWADIDIAAACHRVGVQDGHLASCRVELDEPVDADTIEAAMSSFASIDLPSTPDVPITVVDDPRRPQPRLDRNTADGAAVTVGPIRRTSSAIQFECLAHNTIRGAAGACLYNAELLVERDIV